MSSASSAAALVELLRPFNGLMAAVAVLVGAFVSRSPIHWGQALAGAAAAFAAAGAANAFNDSRDAVPDSINRPGRPVPSGRMSAAAAGWAAAVFAAAAVVLAVPVGAAGVALVVAWLALMALYSVVWKGVALLGNVTVALVASTPFLMGGLSQGNWLSAGIPCGLAFLIHMAREIVKDVEDTKGDEAAGIGTFAVRRGPGAGLFVARGIMLVLIGLAALPFACGVYGWGYAAVVVVIDIVLVWLLVSMKPGSEDTGPRRPSSVLKAVMVLGLASFVAGVLTS